MVPDVFLIKLSVNSPQVTFAVGGVYSAADNQG